MAFYGVGLDVKVRELNLQFKLALQQKGGNSLRNLKNIFDRMDFNGNKKLDPSEFEQALAAFGYFFKIHNCCLGYSQKRWNCKLY